MKTYKNVMLGSVAASVLAAGALVTPAQADGSAVIGHKNGKFYVKSKDGNFSMLPGFNIQAQYEARVNDDDFGETGDTRRFHIRRGRASIKGRAGSPNLTYVVSWDITTNSGQTNGIFDAAVNYKFIPELQVKAGQFKPLGGAFDNAGSSSGFLVEYGNGTVGAITPGRANGIAVHGKLAKVLQYEMTVANGLGNNGGGGGARTEGSKLQFGFRFEPLGKFGNLSQPDYAAKNKLRAQLHGAVAKVQGATAASNGGTNTFITGVNAETNYLFWTGAVGVKYAGAHVVGMFQQINAQATSEGGQGALVDSNGARKYNWMLAGTYMIVPKKFYVAGSYTVENTTTTDSGMDRQWGIGAAYLFRGHAHKLHASFDQITTSTTSVATDGGNDSQSTENNFMVRWQVQF